MIYSSDVLIERLRLEIMVCLSIVVAQNSMGIFRFQ